MLHATMYVYTQVSILALPPGSRLLTYKSAAEQQPQEHGQRLRSLHGRSACESPTRIKKVVVDDSGASEEDLSKPSSWRPRSLAARLYLRSVVNRPEAESARSSPCLVQYSTVQSVCLPSGLSTEKMNSNHRRRRRRRAFP